MWQGGLTVQHQRLQFACAVRQVLQDSDCKRYSIRGTFSSFYLGATGITVVLNTSVADK